LFCHVCVGALGDQSNFKYAKLGKKGSMRIAPSIKRANKMCIGCVTWRRERKGGGEFDTRISLLVPMSIIASDKRSVCNPKKINKITKSPLKD
jgi:hypothetical protein